MMRQRFIFACVLAALGCASPGGLSQTSPKSRAPAPEAAQDEQLYRNAAFGFRYAIPYGWVDRTQEMREHPADEKAEPAPPLDAGSSSSKANASARGKSGKKPESSSEVLLAVFERPPEAAGESVNSAVVIASESAAAYPGLKTAADFLGPLTELTTGQGFKENGDPSGLTIDGRELVRADFTKPLTENLSMHQSTLVLLAKGQIVSFTFIAGSEDEVDDLIENLSFAASRAK